MSIPLFEVPARHIAGVILNAPVNILYVIGA